MQKSVDGTRRQQREGGGEAEDLEGAEKVWKAEIRKKRVAAKGE